MIGENRPAMTEPKSDSFSIRLYLADDGPNAMLAKDNLRAICRRHLGDDRLIEIIDISREPQSALDNGVMHTPLVVVSQANREKRFLGNLSKDADLIRAIAGLQAHES